MSGAVLCYLGCGGGGGGGGDDTTTAGDAAAGDTGGGSTTDTGVLGQVRTSTPSIVRTIVGIPGGSGSGVLGSVSAARQQARLARVVTIPLDTVSDCPLSGSVALVGDFIFDDEATVVAFTIDTVSVLDNCDGVTGTIGILIVGEEISDGLIASETVITGAFAAVVEDVGVCGYATDGLTISLVSDVDGNIFSTFFSGNLASVCEGIVLECSWSNVDPANDQQILDGCSFTEEVV